jgi:hypothetical protein
MSEFAGFLPAAALVPSADELRRQTENSVTSPHAKEFLTETINGNLLFWFKNTLMIPAKALKWSISSQLPAILSHMRSWDEDGAQEVPEPICPKYIALA